MVVPHYHLNPKGHPYYLCNYCGIIFEDPKIYLSNTFDFSKSVEDLTDEDLKIFQLNFLEAIDISDSDGNLYSGYDYEESVMEIGLFNKIDNVINKYTDFKKSDKFSMLEIGCGTGFILKRMKNKYPNCEFVGVDPSPVSCRKGKSSGLNILQGTMDTVTLQNETFDVVICLGNLQLHENPLNTLKKARAVLKNGGLLLFETKNPASLVRIMAKTLINLPFIRRLSFVKYITRHAWDNMRFGFERTVLKNIIEEMDFKLNYIETKPPRLIGYKNNYFLSRSLPGLLWNITDKIDTIRGQRAWVEVCCKK